MNNKPITFKRSFHTTKPLNIPPIESLLVTFDLATLIDIGNLVSHAKEVIENDFRGDMHTARLIDFMSTPRSDGITPGQRLNVNVDAIKNALDNPSSIQKELVLRDLIKLEDHMKTGEDTIHQHKTKYDPNYLGKPSTEIIRDINSVQDKKVTALGKELADLVTKKNFNK
jgi:hypothetical protein